MQLHRKKSHELRRLTFSTKLTFLKIIAFASTLTLQRTELYSTSKWSPLRLVPERAQWIRTAPTAFADWTFAKQCHVQSALMHSFVMQFAVKWLKDTPSAVSLPLKCAPNCPKTATWLTRSFVTQTFSFFSRQKRQTGTSIPLKILQVLNKLTTGLDMPASFQSRNALGVKRLWLSLKMTSIYWQMQSILRRCWCSSKLPNFMSLRKFLQRIQSTSSQWRTNYSGLCTMIRWPLLVWERRKTLPYVLLAICSILAASQTSSASSTRRKAGLNTRR